MAIVAIQTPHYAHNYGAQLQAFALGLAVKNLGYEVEYIDRRPSTYFEFTSCIDRWLKNIQLRTEGKGFVDFENKYLTPKSIRLLHNEEYDKLDTSRYHAIIVGSDQIWRDDYFYHSFEYSPYLYFADGSKTLKISYAASFGKETCTPPEERRVRIAELLQDFTAISVREVSGVNILKSVYNADGVWVADPTLLHDSKTYIENLGLTKLKVQNNEIVTYILGASPENMEMINEVASLMRTSVNHIYKRSTHWWMYKRPFSLIKKYKKVPSVIEWLNNILNARFVFTDSFHGMVFCILFKKQFVVMNNKAGGTERFTSLLSKLGLETRLCDWGTSPEEIAQLLKAPIDYNSAYSKLNDFKNESYHFLKKNLCKTNS